MLLLDSLAPLTSHLKAHHKGDKLDQKEVIQAVRSGIQLIGNANAHLSHLRRERVVSDFNKTLLPIVGDDSNLKDATVLVARNKNCPSCNQAMNMQSRNDVTDQYRLIKMVIKKLGTAVAK